MRTPNVTIDPRGITEHPALNLETEEYPDLIATGVNGTIVTDKETGKTYVLAWLGAWGSRYRPLVIADGEDARAARNSASTAALQLYRRARQAAKGRARLPGEEFLGVGSVTRNDEVVIGVRDDEVGTPDSEALQVSPLHLLDNAGDSATP